MTAPGGNYYNQGGGNDALQLIAALSNISIRKKQMALDQARFKEQQHQFAVAHGFDEKSEHFKQLMTIADNVSKLPIGSSRDAEIHMATALGFQPQEIAALAQLGQGMPNSPSAIQAQAATRGYAAMNPQQQAAVNQEAATGAATGMNTGQMATSGLVRQIAGQRIAPQDLAALAQGFQVKAATGQTPEDFAKGQWLMNSGHIGDAAAVASGLAMTPAQKAQADIGRGEVQAAFARVNEEAIAAANALGLNQAALGLKAGKEGMMTPAQRAQMLMTVPKLLDDIEANKASKQGNAERIRVLNAIAGYAGMPWLAIQDPSEAPAKVPLIRQQLQGILQPQVPAMPQARPDAIVQPPGMSSLFSPWTTPSPQPTIR